MAVSIDSREELLKIIQIVKSECVCAALQSYENASISGLCHEGAWEAAISAIRDIDAYEIIKKL